MTRVLRSFEPKDSNKKLTNQEALVNSFAHMTAEYVSIQPIPLRYRELIRHHQGIAKRDGYVVFTSSGPLSHVAPPGTTPGEDYGYIASGKIDKEGHLKEVVEHGIGAAHHPGGIQTIGDWVVVPVAGYPSGWSSKRKSEIRFYKYKGEIHEERQLTICREGNAGSVGITNYGKDGDERYLLATLPKDNEVHFYWTQPGVPLSDKDCRFSGPKQWKPSGKVAEIWKGYNNNCSLVADEEGNIYFIGLEKKEDHDYADLYKVCIDVNKECEAPKLSYIGSFKFKLKDGPMSSISFKDGPSFRWAASVLVTSSDNVELIASAFDLQHGMLTFAILD